MKEGDIVEEVIMNHNKIKGRSWKNKL